MHHQGEATKLKLPQAAARSKQIPEIHMLPSEGDELKIQAVHDMDFPANLLVKENLPPQSYLGHVQGD